MQKNPRPLVFRLGHATLMTADVERAARHYREVLGLREVERGPDGTRYLSVGYDHHAIALKPADRRGLGNLGYQLAPGVGLHDVEEHLRRHGLAPARKGDAEPGIADLVEVVGPGGAVLQFYEAMAAPAPGFGRAGVVPTRFGHVAVTSSDPAGMVRLYHEVLGFWITDWIGDFATFLTCNRDHHVVNVVGLPGDAVHHLAFELTGRAHQFDAADFLRGAGVGTVWGPSRHTAGHNLASYHHDPDGVLIELYTDLDVFVPEQGFCEPRPWHEELPMTPRRWSPEGFSAWETGFVFDFQPVPPT